VPSILQFNRLRWLVIALHLPLLAVLYFYLKRSGLSPKRVGSKAVREHI